jgi:hypothetical protein
MSIPANRINPVPTKNSESCEKSRVLGFTAIVFPECLNMCVSSSPFSPADSVAGRWWNWRTSRSVISCTFFVASGRVGPPESGPELVDLRIEDDGPRAGMLSVAQPQFVVRIERMRV